MTVRELKIPPDEQIVELLEDMTEQAKSGRLRSVAVSGQVENETFTVWRVGAHGDNTKLYFATRSMLRRMESGE